MVSGYLVIYIRTLMVSHVLIYYMLLIPPSPHPLQSICLFFSLFYCHLSGEFVFALSSDDNSEFWLSTDVSPLNVQLLAIVGKVRMSSHTLSGHFLILLLFKNCFLAVLVWCLFALLISL